MLPGVQSLYTTDWSLATRYVALFPVDSLDRIHIPLRFDLHATASTRQLSRLVHPDLDMAAVQPFSEMEPTWLTSMDGLGIGTLIVTIILGVFSLLLVALRTWTRFTTSTFGVDDGLMVVGVVRERLGF